MALVRSSSTLHIKQKYGIAIYRLRPGDKEAIQNLLDGHLAEPRVAI
jgi:hypothetical protein